MLARLLQAHLQARLGRTVLVENKSGAAGSPGAAQFAKCSADFSAFFAKQVSLWGKVVRENNIKA